MRALATTLRAVGRIEMIVATGAFVVICAVVGTNAFLRYALNSSLIWSEEVALLATHVLVFVGAAVIMKGRADISVLFLVAALPGRLRAGIGLATEIAAAAFFACLLVYALALWPLQRNTTTFILDINRYWFTLPLVWAAFSMLLTALYRIVLALGDPDESGERSRLLTLEAEPE